MALRNLLAATTSPDFPSVGPVPTLLFFHTPQSDAPKSPTRTSRPTILNMESGDFDMRMEVRDQIARVRVTPRPTRHRRTLRSQNRAELAFLPSASSPLSQPPIMAEDLHDPAIPKGNGGLSDGESDRVMKELEMEMEELDELEETNTAPPTPKTNITHPAEDESRIDIPSSPLASRGSRVWETNRPSSQDFIIWEDTPEDQEAAEAAADDNYIDVPDEDKENMSPATSELEDEAEQEQAEGDAERQPLIDWTQAGVGPRDAFGVPLNHDMALFINDNPTILPNTPRPGFRRRRRLRTAENNLDSDDAQQSVVRPEMLQFLITADGQRRPVVERTPLGTLDTTQPRWNFEAEFQRILEPRNREPLARQRFRLGSDDSDEE